MCLSGIAPLVSIVEWRHTSFTTSILKCTCNDPQDKSTCTCHRFPLFPFIEYWYYIKRPLSYFYSRGKTSSCKHYLDKPYSWKRLSVEAKRKKTSKKYTDLILLFSATSPFSFSTNMFLFFLQKNRTHTKKCLLNYPQCTWTWHFTHTPPILFDAPSYYLDTL